MSDSKNSAYLIKNMNPVLEPDEYVFCSVPKSSSIEPRSFNPVCIFKETESVSFIITRETADREKLKYNVVFKMITLSVYSDLEAVGFLSAILGKLAEAGISVNPVSAYNHDYLFVPLQSADDAMNILAQIAFDSQLI